MNQIIRKIPLLKDHHTHPFLYSALDQGVNLSSEGFNTQANKKELRESALNRIRERASQAIPGWIIAYGWNSGLFDLYQADFDNLTTPIVVLNLSLHGNIVNQAGRFLVQRVAPEIAANLDDQTWIERNLREMLNIFASDGATVERLQNHFEHLLNDHGIYHAEEMLLGCEHEIRLFEDAGLVDRTRFWAAPDTFDKISHDLKAKVYGIKLFSDGAIGSWTAALNQPYRAFPTDALWGNRGILMYENDELKYLLEKYLGMGLPVAVHAIGDRAIDQVVTTFAGIRPPKESEFRIEHAQLISEPMALLAKDLGITLSMQPNFSEDSLSYENRLPEGYAEKNNPFRMLIEKAGFQPGVDLLFGSDGMPHGYRYGLQKALFPDRFANHQTLSIDEFIEGYCMQGNQSGCIEINIDTIKRNITGKVILG
jgi:predicted amidohydrolase YtcJ